MIPNELHCIDGLFFENDLQAFVFPKRHKRKYEIKPCHFPKCACGTSLDCVLRRYKDGTKHIYLYCEACFCRASSPVPRSLFSRGVLWDIYRGGLRGGEIT